MKTLRRKLAVAILTLILANSASATTGQIQFPGAVSTGTGSTPLTTTVVLAVVSVVYS